MRNNRLAIRIMIGAMCVAIAASAIALVAFAWMKAAFQPWALYTFEAVTLVACVLGLLFALGRFSGAPALTLLCVAGSIAVGSVLINVALRGQLDIKNSADALALRPWLVARLAASTVMAVIGATLVLNRDARSWPLLVRGIAAGAPLVVIAGAVYWLRGHGGMPGMPQWLTAILAMTGAIVVGVSLCASAHFLIRAFETGTDAAELTPPTGARSS